MSHENRGAASLWRKIIGLGDALLKVADLAAQRKLIVRTASELLNARARLWLDERLFRLPGLNQTPLFPTEPETELMRRTYASSGLPWLTSDSGSKAASVIRNQEISLGVLEISRPDGDGFRPAELLVLEGLVGHVALALTASHRFAVEQWRIEQLMLVRRVSAQIANVLDLDKLTHQIARLILQTFHFYYVSIFTLEKGRRSLRFRAGAGPAGRDGHHRASPKLKVELGQGLVGTVAQTGEEATANDVSREPRYRYIEELPDTRSEAVLPLKIEDRILGVLDIQSERPEAFHPNDLLVLRALADTIAIAINGARLYGDLRTRAEQLAMVTEVSEDIASILDLDELLGKVAALIQERLGYPYIHLFSVHPNRRQIIYEAGSTMSKVGLKGYVLDLDRAEGMIPWVARHAESILANDVHLEPRYRPSPFPPDDTRAELTIPLIYDNQVVGVLDLQSDHLNAFNQEDRSLLEALGDNVAVAMHNADLYRTERWRRQVADSLREVAGLLSSDYGVDEVLDRVLRELERNLPCDVSTVWLLEGDRLYPAHVHGAGVEEVRNAAQRWPESYEFLRAVLASSEPVLRKPDDPLGPSGIASGFSADYSSIVASLSAGDRQLGVLTLSHHAANRYGHEAQAMTATFASYAAVAIENARLYDAAQEQAYASAALLQVAQSVANSNNLEETVTAVVRVTPMLVGVQACAIYLWEAERYPAAQSYGFPDSVEKLLCGRDLASGEFTLLDAVRTGSRIVVASVPSTTPEEWLNPVLATSDEDALALLEGGDHLLIGFPLMIKSDFYGVLLVEDTDQALRFRQKRVEIINSIAQQVALSIQNEHLQQEMVTRERLEREVELARQIQMTFLPDHLPEFPNWDLAATWRTAREVGGDFYDVFELGGGRLGLFIADVSDKGIPAALFMALTRTLVRAAIKDTTSPAEVMHRVNELIIPDNQQDMFVTAVYGVLSLDTGSLTYTNCGHNPPIWLHDRDHRLETLPRTGPALGVIAGAGIEEHHLLMAPGDSLLWYTDGVTETFSPEDETYDEWRLSEMLRSVRNLGARGLLEAVEKAVDEFRGPRPATDDLTMLAVKRLEIPHGLQAEGEVSEAAG